MSAEQLWKAAASMRERATLALDAWGDGAWTADESGWDDRQGSTYDVKVDGSLVAAAAVEELAEHIAGWHPAVALAVAEWIDTHAHDLSASGRITSCDSPGDVEAALTVARAYLGESG